MKRGIDIRTVWFKLDTVAIVRTVIWIHCEMKYDNYNDINRSLSNIINELSTLPPIFCILYRSISPSSFMVTGLALGRPCICPNARSATQENIAKSIVYKLMASSRTMQQTVLWDTLFLTYIMIGCRADRQNSDSRCTKWNFNYFSSRLAVVFVQSIEASCRKWRCSWSSADRLCCKYIWLINNLIAY